MKLNVELRRILLELAARPGGACAADATSYGFTSVQAGNAMARMNATGQLHQIKLGHRTARFFTSPEAAKRFQNAYQRPVKATPSGSGPRARAPWPRDAPAIETANTKYTFCPPCQLGLRTNTHSP